MGRPQGIEAALDALLGGCPGGEGAAAAAAARHLPQTCLEASRVLPWQAALAAALGVLGQCAGQLAPGPAALGALVRPEARAAAAAAALKASDPNHSRNAWQAVSRGAAAAPAGTSLLHYAGQLRGLAAGHGRVAPPLLEAFAAWASLLAVAAEEEEAALLQAAEAAPGGWLGGVDCCTLRAVARKPVLQACTDLKLLPRFLAPSVPRPSPDAALEPAARPAARHVDLPRARHPHARQRAAAAAPPRQSTASRGEGRLGPAPGRRQLPAAALG